MLEHPHLVNDYFSLAREYLAVQKQAFFACPNLD